ncbi:hypothetical protein OBBRIDRAFT_691715, partial [Obba rivulosa]
VEDVEDEEWGGLPKHPWVESFSGAGLILKEGVTVFERLKQKKDEKNEPPWAPFESQDEWRLAQWLLSSGLTQKAIDDFLKLHITQDRMRLSFHNKYTFFQKVDQLPRATEWECEKLDAVGDQLDENGNPRTETLELWKRNPIECIQELSSNPAFYEHMRYAPERLYGDPMGKERLYENMWTGDWWWEMQTKLPPGTTIAPIILASDKTNLSRFSGDKSAWPVYLSIGNISKDIRRKPSAHATILIGYLPVSKLKCFSKATRAVEGYRLFHRCMRSLLDPLISAGRDGVEMICADGFIRRVYPILAAYIADHPEQCLVACCQKNFCPKCFVARNDRGEARTWPMRNPQDIRDVLEAAAQGAKPVKFKEWGLCAVSPFWKDLPHCDIFSALTPDILHQLHKGVFKDHVVNWSTACVSGGEVEVDRRFRMMPRHASLRHFKKGISLVTQWTGTEFKNMEKVFLGALAGSAEKDVILAVRAVLDFIYYAHFEIHS